MKNLLFVLVCFMTLPSFASEENPVFDQATCAVRVGKERATTTIELRENNTSIEDPKALEIKLQGYTCKAEVISAAYADIGLIRNLQLIAPDGRVTHGLAGKDSLFFRQGIDVANDSKYDSKNMSSVSVHCTCAVY